MMKKLFSSVVVFVVAFAPLMVLPVTAGATEQAPQCIDNVQNIFSDTATTNTTDNQPAVLLTFIHPAWTASIPGASWIWSTNPVANPTQDETKVFTRTFTITGTPADATLQIATDNTYDVTVNGKEEHSSAAEDNFSAVTPITIPAGDLVTGTNTLSITVTNVGVAGSDAQGNPAGLLYGLTVHENICNGTIELKNLVSPSSTNNFWNFGIDSASTLWDTWKTDGYDSGAITVPAGPHSVSEQKASGTDVSQYPSSFTCTDGSTVVASGGPQSLQTDGLTSPEFTVAPGQHIVCTFTQSYVGVDEESGPATIQVINVVTPHDVSKFWNFGISNTSLWATWQTDGYDSGEVPTPVGYQTVTVQTAWNTNSADYFTDISCKDGNTVIATSTRTSLQTNGSVISNPIDLFAGHHVVCTVTNTLAGKIELKKVINPSINTVFWNLGIDNSYTLWDTWKTDGYDSGPVNVFPGSHSLSEQTAPGTDGSQYASSLDCVNGSTSVASTGPMFLVNQDLDSGPFDVASGDHIMCTFTDNAVHVDTSNILPILEVKNIVLPHSTTTSFWNFGIDSASTLWDTWKTDGYDSGPISVAVGPHTVSLQKASGTDVSDFDTSVECKDGSSTVLSAGPLSLNNSDFTSSPLNLIGGHTVLCTFTQTSHSYVPPVAPEVPTLTSPANPSVLNPTGLILDWSDVTATSGPVTYYYQSGPSSATTTDNALIAHPYGPLPLADSQIDASATPDGTYYWQVKACDSTNNCSAWSGPWKVTVDSIAPTSSFTSPSPDTVVTSDTVTLSGTTTDLNGVASTTLAYATYNPATSTPAFCGDYTNITSLVNVSQNSPFNWTYDWTPVADGSYCFKAHGQDIAGNHEMSPFVTNVTYKKPTSTTPTNPPTDNGGNGGGGSTGGSTGGNGGGGSNGPVSGSLGGGSTGGSTGGTSTTGTSNPSTTSLSANDNTGNGANTDTSNQVATVYSPSHTQGDSGSLTGGSSTSSVETAGTVSPDLTQTAAAVAGASWLSWKTGLWILLALIILILLIIFFSRNKKDDTMSSYK